VYEIQLLDHAGAFFISHCCLFMVLKMCTCREYEVVSHQTGLSEWDYSVSIPIW